jgi:type VI protein secretion system component Hcp
MEEVMVTALSTGASAGEAAPTENVTISFAKVTFAVDTESEGWNIPDNAPF